MTYPCRSPDMICPGLEGAGNPLRARLTGLEGVTRQSVVGAALSAPVQVVARALHLFRCSIPTGEAAVTLGQCSYPAHAVVPAVGRCPAGWRGAVPSSISANERPVRACPAFMAEGIGENYESPPYYP